MARTDELRLIAKVARLYYEHGVRQTDIAAQLDLSQTTVSRLLKRAEEEQIVRITVSVPLGAYTELEEELEAAYGLKEAIVVDTGEDDEQILRDLGAAAAYYVETTLKPGEVIGISSWSATLLAMVDAMHPLPRSSSAQVVQILGGVGNPAAEVHAAHLTRRMATLTRGGATFLPAPGVAGSAETARIYHEDPFVRAATALFDQVTLALVGIGAVEPSKLLASSGNIFSVEELRLLRERGTVGDICLRFFDQEGRPVLTPLDERVIGMRLEQLRQVPRSVGIAGGRRKLAAIRGALAGRWVNVLITDQHTAGALVAEARAGRATLAPALAPGQLQTEQDAR
ncbi:MAG TPA: sugar-binding transcriptional regulator [Roseiflexaceae bacterium]|nr:sugar-binding transcriptional regulator [Roseiflexaceae bacterium]